jgi:hypothetical protein
LARLVSLVGLSPGTPHTGACLLKAQGVTVDEVVVLGNVGEAVGEAVRILEECPCPTGSLLGVRASGKILGFPDVRSQEDLGELGSTLRSLLRPGDIVDITGGRKIASAWAAIVALNAGARVVATIVPQEEAERALKAGDPCGKTARRARLVWLV